MSIELNTSLVRRYFDECVNEVNRSDERRALEVVDELMTDDFVMFYNNDTDDQAQRGRDQHKSFLVGHARAYPDDDWTIETLIANDDVVACVWRIRSRHAASGNRIDVRAADFFRVREGRLAELRRFLDFKDLDRQARRSHSNR
jgi:ketosteroid isomerase-like protein